MRGKYGEVFKFQPALQHDRWYCVETYCKLNTPGIDGRLGKKDGVLRAWIDGRLAFEKTDIRFRDVDWLRIETLWMNVYHGGTRPAPGDLHLYIDNVIIARQPIGLLKEQ
jgi:hypothetical protein